MEGAPGIPAGSLPPCPASPALPPWGRYGGRGAQEGRPPNSADAPLSPTHLGRLAEGVGTSLGRADVTLRVGPPPAPSQPGAPPVPHPQPRPDTPATRSPPRGQQARTCCLHRCRRLGGQPARPGPAGPAPSPPSGPGQDPGVPLSLPRWAPILRPLPDCEPVTQPGICEIQRSCLCLWAQRDAGTCSLEKKSPSWAQEARTGGCDEARGASPRARLASGAGFLRLPGLPFGPGHSPRWGQCYPGRTRGASLASASRRPPLTPHPSLTPTSHLR